MNAAAPVMLPQKKAVAHQTMKHQGDTRGKKTFVQASSQPASCACGGSCPRCQAKTNSLNVSQPHDPAEVEADQVADRVMRISDTSNNGEISTLSTSEPRILRRALNKQASHSDVGPEIKQVLQSSGQPLAGAQRQFMESRFGQDFGDVKIHKDATAAASAEALKARAYTIGNDIVFGAGQYTPENITGKQLLAHELTHVVQQSTTPAQASNRVSELPAITNTREATISRATLTEGGVSAEINYGDLINIPSTDYPSTIVSRYLAYTGITMDPALSARVIALTFSQQEWLLFGLDILSENTTGAPGLSRVQAFERLVERALISTTRGLGTASFAFEHEVLTVSGWFEQAMANGLLPPSPAQQLVIDPLLNPPPSASAPPGGLLDLATLQAELPVLTRARLGLSANDPNNWPGTRVQPLAQVQSVGDVIQAQARVFFSPFSETARDNRWLAAWQYSGNIQSVTTDALGNPAAVTAAERLSLLRNRATGAARDNRAGDSLFSRTNFDADRDAAQFDILLTAMNSDPIVRATLERQFRHTGHLERPSLQVAISTEVSSGVSECDTRWRTVRTLCHELMHSLAHPDFITAIAGSTRFPTGVNFDQVLVEGFAEVLGVQLFNNLIASTDATLLASLTQGVPGACARPTTTVSLGYPPAGPSAELIRAQIGNQRFRAAYFHGQTSLIGL